MAKMRPVIFCRRGGFATLQRPARPDRARVRTYVVEHSLICGECGRTVRPDELVTVHKPGPRMVGHWYACRTCVPIRLDPKGGVRQ